MSIRCNSIGVLNDERQKTDLAGELIIESDRFGE